MARSSISSLLVVCTLLVASRFCFIGGFSAAPRSLTRREATQVGTVEVEVTDVASEKNSSLPAASATKSEEEKLIRAAAKTAETKQRVAEKKQRLQAEAQRTASESGESDFELIDWMAYAAEAKSMAEEAGKEAQKPGKERAFFRAKELGFQAAGAGLEALAGLPPLVPVAGAAALALLLLIGLASPRDKPAPPPAVRAPVASVISVETSKTAPSMPPAASVATSTATRAAATAAAPADLPWARSLASTAASALRSAADGLPVAEKVVEQELPVAQSALQWASGVTPDNAKEKVEKEAVPALGRAAADAVRAGLRVGSSGLDLVGKNLPAAEQAVGSAVDKGLPYFQSALHEAASNARRLSTQKLDLPEQEAVQGVAAAAPGLLNAAANFLDLSADAAPQVKSAVGFATGAVTPLAQTALSVASNLADKAADVPQSTVEEGVSKLVDTVKTVPEAAEGARQLLAELK
ncbi:unnamed protein product [Effrenium voratum]|uniref:Uncharacterized protein n=1 Tax=Effrenium voratum TaxID=2562239 RepID=A0AA36N328_9DINO|nr:unnamed protein product [Effrenium voratum]CAJ1438117.1 unnamed protein product [Effrenium voratum]